jgi:DNA repair exonuclease SbcCD ATPase subunit
MRGLNTCIAIALVLALAAATTSKISKELNGYALFERLEKDDFGKKILDTVALQLKNKSPVTDISQLLNNIRVDIQNEQRKADSAYAGQQRECEETIDDLNGRINAATDDINEAAFAINKLNTRVNTYTVDIENKAAQIQILGEKDQQLREERQEDAAAFAQRQGQTREVVAALDLIIPRLKSIQATGDEEEALIELGKIGKSNPIHALVQVATSLDQDALLIVIQKLEAIRDSLVESLDEDQENEEETIEDYELLLGEIDNVRTNLETARAQSQQENEEAQAQLQSQRSRLGAARQEFDNASEGKQLKGEECDNYDVRYTTETNKRVAQLEVISQILNILATKLDSLDSYVKYR